MSFIDKTKLVIELPKGVYDTLVYLSKETGMTVLKLIEDFITDNANDLAQRFYEMDVKESNYVR